jgi:hypothetical protein
MERCSSNKERCSSNSSNRVDRARMIDSHQALLRIFLLSSSNLFDNPMFNANVVCGKLNLDNDHTIFLLSFHLSSMCTSDKTTSRRPLLASKLSKLKASSPSPKCSFVVIPPVLPSRITPIPKISLAMRPRRTTALPLALTEDWDSSYGPTPLFYEDKVPDNDEHCLMTPKYILGQRSALDSPPPLRCPSADISIITPTSSPIPERLIFPDF